MPRIGSLSGHDTDIFTMHGIHFHHDRAPLYIITHMRYMCYPFQDITTAMSHVLRIPFVVQLGRSGNHWKESTLAASPKGDQAATAVRQQRALAASWIVAVNNAHRRYHLLLSWLPSDVRPRRNGIPKNFLLTYQ